MDSRKLYSRGSHDLVHRGQRHLLLRLTRCNHRIVARRTRINMPVTLLRNTHPQKDSITLLTRGRVSIPSEKGEQFALVPRQVSRPRASYQTQTGLSIHHTLINIVQDTHARLVLLANPISLELLQVLVTPANSVWRMTPLAFLLAVRL